MDVSTGVQTAWRSDRRRARLDMPDDDSLDTFILDHHWGYCSIAQDGFIEYEVDRTPWRTYPVGGFELDVDTARVYGPGVYRSAQPTTDLGCPGGGLGGLCKLRRKSSTIKGEE